MTAPVTLTPAGYYTYRESIAASRRLRRRSDRLRRRRRDHVRARRAEGHDGLSNAVVRAGSQIFDRLTVTGLGQTPATSSSSCSARTRRAPTSTAPARRSGRARSPSTGDGTLQRPEGHVRRVGFYVFREKIAGSETVTGRAGECAVEAETSLGRPPIVTGRGDPDVALCGPRARRARPSRRACDRPLGIDARISGVGIDRSKGRARHPEGHRPGRLVGRRRGAGRRARRDPARRPRRLGQARRRRVLRAQGRRRGAATASSSTPATADPALPGDAVQRMRKEACRRGIFSRTGSAAARARHLRRAVRRPPRPLPRQHRRHGRARSSGPRASPEPRRTPGRPRRRARSSAIQSADAGSGRADGRRDEDSDVHAARTRRAGPAFPPRRPPRAAPARPLVRARPGPSARPRRARSPRARAHARRGGIPARSGELIDTVAAAMADLSAGRAVDAEPDRGPPRERPRRPARRDARIRPGDRRAGRRSSSRSSRATRAARCRPTRR